MKLINQKELNRSDPTFEVRATAALGISIVVDALDYIGAPIFALPVVGDLVDATVMAILYRLTGSKISTAINSIEFIPFIGDMVPAYTISTLLWILRESAHRRKKQGVRTLLMNQSNRSSSVTRISDDGIEQRNIVDAGRITEEGFRTKATRLYAIFRSRAS
jgi:hypothetical protein